jgi:acyl-CoA dehydrogenase
VTAPDDELVARAEELSRDVLARFAPIVDAENRFPREPIAALQGAGLFRFMVPEAFGGVPSTFATYARVAAALGEGCLSTAVIWAMHCQQVATLAAHARDAQSDVLRDVAQTGSLIASVTTEPGGGGDQISARAPLAAEGAHLRVRRECPTVSFGAEARFYLVTMLAAEDRPPHDVRLVLVRREDEGAIEVLGGWDALGVHGTRTVPMRFDVAIDPARAIGGVYRDVALRTMIPSGQLGCSAAWYGAARGALRRWVRWARGGRGLASDRVLGRLARLRLALDLVGASIERVADRLDRLGAEGAPLSAYEAPAHLIELNGMKVAASEEAARTLDALIELSGMREGYMTGGELGLERVYRDVRSATLMFGNERLLAANARLMVLESTPMGART